VNKIIITYNVSGESEEDKKLRKDFCKFLNAEMGLDFFTKENIGTTTTIETVNQTEFNDDIGLDFEEIKKAIDNIKGNSDVTYNIYFSTNQYYYPSKRNKEINIIKENDFIKNFG